MKLHSEVLDDAQDRVARGMAEAARAEGLYLGGGTAVALWLGHRRSIDLDWFSEQPIAEPERLIRRLQAGGIDLQPRLVEPGTIHGEVDKVRVSILQFPYPALRPVEQIESIPLAHLDDLACMKLEAVAGRGSKKDFVDIFALCRAHVPLPELLELYRRRFPEGNVAHVLMSLTYFDDAERTAMPHMLWSIDWPEVRSRLEGCADAIELGA